MKKIRTITENRKFKIVEKKGGTLKSDMSDSKPHTPAIKPSSSNIVKSSKSLEKNAKIPTKKIPSYLSATKLHNKKLSFFRRCLHFLFGITMKFERIRIFYGENAYQDPIFRHANNSVKTTK